ncbi:MAG TPA: AraC family transcriptional regulator [Aromatoleum sp.]|uniref:AraC family transcriptional regulator n=1 Tax=Aromatoleum sp. TaxID=2307007 RepID=UPI002B488225|nr:AraC family transcriptional regulator [Aromatoleum sp.]HJV25200.1 AraC family transcriptional regulator [Aromatoleum sp.]
MSVEKGTISICFVADALLEAQQRGIDTAALMVEAGIAPDLLDRPMARVSPQQYGALWHAVAVALGDEFFGMDSHPMRSGSFAILCHAVLDCTDLGHALGRAFRFFSLVLDDVCGALTIEGQRAVLTLADRTTATRLFAHGTLFVILHGLASWLTGRRLPILETAFRQEAPPHVAEYRLIFGDPLAFGQPASRLVLDVRSLALPVIRDAKSATEFLRQAPANFLVKYRSRGGAVARVRARLSGIELAEWPTFDALAAAMRTTPSTLRRRLEREGSSYRTIKDDLRCDYAIDFLCNSRLSVEDVARALGFAEHSAFYRAFRKWTGVSPGEYRDGATRSSVRSSE